MHPKIMHAKLSRVIQEAVPAMHQVKLVFKPDADDKDICYLLYLNLLGWVDLSPTDADALEYASLHKGWACDADRTIVIGPHSDMRSSEWMVLWQEEFVDKLYQALEDAEVVR